MDAHTREQWRAAADRILDAWLDAGQIVPTDRKNPAHQRIIGIVLQLADAHGMLPNVYFRPVRGEDAAARERDHRRSLGEFGGWAANETIIIPESAHDLLTDAELAAVLTHEFDHLLRPEQALEHQLLYQRYEAAYQEWQAAKEQQAAPQELAKLEQTWQERIGRSADAITRLEVQADERAIDSGHAQGLMGALQKIFLHAYYSETPPLPVSPEIIGRMSAAHAKAWEGDNRLIATHTKESFVERLSRMEQAARRDALSRG